ncbi:MAG TPA: DRTGG domain-containing protein [Acidobacteriota bacterium]|nr:DRTGG domain-containing protein [Acidobacteriota bacterium]
MPSTTTVKQLTLADVRDILDAEVLNGDDLNVMVIAVGAADLLSDVLATSKTGTLLLTGLLSTQVIRTAIVADLCGVVFVRGKKPGEDILSLARESKIPVLSTRFKMFEASGRIYSALAESTESK